MTAKTIDEQLSAPKRALLALRRLKSRVHELEQASSEPIAVVGMSCRFPSAPSLEGYWRLLLGGAEGIVEIPGDRWDVAQYFDEDPDAPGKMYSRWGGFLSEVDQFDAALFGITPREASTMDPAHRQLLEVAWEALEHAGYSPGGDGESDVGVFLGAAGGDYGLRFLADGFRHITAHTSTGGAGSVAAGRLAHTFGFRGPNLSLDTACSSSLVATHLAVRALRRGECRMALTGGTMLILTPGGHIAFCKSGMLARDGRCKTFDASADGFTRGEGCGILVLKRLSDALRDRDNVVALIRAVSINHDGRTGTLTAPSGLAQEAALRAALAEVGLAATDVAFLECHGTGTALGDPIEMQAAAAVYGRRQPQARLALGSTKANVGHLEIVAGAAGLIKALLCLQREQLPPQRNLSTINPHIPLAQLALAVPTAPTPWPESGAPRRAAVSSFGFSGTNAHAVLESAPPVAVASPAGHGGGRPWHPVVLSARSRAAVQALARRQLEHLQAHPDLAPADVAFTTTVGRARLAFRLATVVQSTAQLIQRLERLVQGDRGDWIEGALPIGVSIGRPAFAFAPLSALRAGAGRTLYKSEPIFRDAFDECARLVAEHEAVDLVAVLLGSDAQTQLQSAANAAPALLALQVALYRQWTAWGIAPAAVVGFGLGELAAGVASGVMPLGQAIPLALAVGRALEQTARLVGTEMAVVALDEEDLARELTLPADEVRLAAVQPGRVVLAGASDPLAAVLAALAERGHRSARISPSWASAAIMPPAVRQELGAQLSRLELAAPLVPLLSGSHRAQQGNRLADAAHFREALAGPMRFGAAAAALRQAGVTHVIEVGPDAVLSALQRAHAADDGAQWLPSLRQGAPDHAQLLASLCRLHCAGVRIDWAAVAAPTAARRVVLATYPFEHRRHWVEVSEAIGQSDDGSPAAGPELSSFLGRHLVRSRFHLFEAHWTPSRPAWLADHKLHDMVVVPGMAYVDLLLDAASAALGDGPVTLVDLVFHQPIIFTEEEQLHRVQVLLHPEEQGSRRAEILSTVRQDDEGWQLRASCRLRPGAMRAADEVGLDSARERCPDELPVATMSAQPVEGLEFGPTFRTVDRLWYGPQEAVGQLSRPASIAGEAHRYHVFPGNLDSCLVVSGATRASERGGAPGQPAGGGPYIPLGIDEVRFFRRPGRTLWCHAWPAGEVSRTGETVTADLRLFDDAGEVVLEMRGLQRKRAPRDALMRGLPQRVDQLLCSEVWRERAASASAGEPGPPITWLLLGGEDDELAQRLRRSLQARGARCELVPPEASGSPTEGNHRGLQQALEQTAGDVALACLPPPGAGFAPQAPALQVQAQAERQCAQLLAAVRTLASVTAASSEPRIALVTRGACPLPPSPCADLGAAPAWALLRSVAQELAELHPLAVDLSPDGAPEIDALADELTRSGESEPEVALRGERRYVRRLVPAAAPASTEPFQASADGTYLVTGAFGGIGRLLTRWLVQGGARALLLVGRSDPHGEAAELVAELAATGCRVATVACDVADADAVQARIVPALAGLPPLRGIFHAAGVLDDGVVTRQSWQRVVSVLSPKVAGAWNLHLLSAAHPVEQFVLFSSVASLLGARGQGSYGAANGFLDALAHQRRSQQLSALSINWGAWHGVGMAAGMAPPPSSAPLEAELALEALGRLCVGGAPQAGVLAPGWAQTLVSATASAPPPLLEELRRVPPAAPAERAGGGLAQRLQRVAETERHALLTTLVRDTVSELVGIEAEQVGDELKLTELGVDSLVAIDLRNALKAELGVSLPASFVFEYPTTAEMAHYLARELPAVEPTEAADGGGAQLERSADVGAGAPVEHPTDAPVDHRAESRDGGEVAAAAPPAPEPAADHGMNLVEQRPLPLLVSAGRLPPVDAAVIKYLPKIVLSAVELPPGAVIEQYGDLPCAYRVVQTTVGRLAYIMIPRFSERFDPDNPDETLAAVRAGADLAAAMQARVVGLTGHLQGFVTDFGRALAPRQQEIQGPPISTALATIVATAALGLEQMASWRGLRWSEQRLSLFGVNPMGLLTLELLAREGQIPASVTLVDASQEYLERGTQLLQQGGYPAAIRAVELGSSAAGEAYDAALVIGAHPDTIDAELLCPGALVMDISYKDSLPAAAAMARMHRAGDILVQKGIIIVRTPEPARSVIYRNPSALHGDADVVNYLAGFEQDKDPQAFMTCCELSPLLSAAQLGCAPTVGEPSLDNAMANLRIFREQNYAPAWLRCGEGAVPEAIVAEFRRRFGPGEEKD